MLNDTELSDLITALQSSTPLSRVGHDEARAIFARIALLGYVISKTKPVK